MMILYYLSKIVWNIIGCIDQQRYARHYGVTIGENCLFDTKYIGGEPYLITIGNNVQITQDVHFYTHGGGHVARQKYSDFDLFGKIIVCDNAYVGGGSHLMPGITIGEGALVAAGSVVTKSVPPRMVVGGNPAHIICSVDEYIANNLKFNTHTKGLSDAEKKEMLLSLSDDKFIKK